MKITLRHVSKARMCRRGARRWFERYGLDYTEFRLHGIDEEVLLATGCAMAKRVVKVAHERG